MGLDGRHEISSVFQNLGEVWVSKKRGDFNVAMLCKLVWRTLSIDAARGCMGFGWVILDEERAFVAVVCSQWQRACLVREGEQ